MDHHQFSGPFTIEDTKDLANTLKSGRMPAPARIVQEEVVGPTLGAQSIQQGLWSFAIAFVLLMIYMVIMYDVIPGMLANCALLAQLILHIRYSGIIPVGTYYAWYCGYRTYTWYCGRCKRTYL